MGSEEVFFIFFLMLKKLHAYKLMGVANREREINDSEKERKHSANTFVFVKQDKKDADMNNACLCVFTFVY